MSASKAHDKLSIKRPPGSLVGLITLSSILFQVFLVGIFQIGTLAYVTQQPWMISSNQSIVDIKENAKTMESTGVFLISTFMYVAMAFVYAKGPPYRQPILTNMKFVVSLVLLIAINIWLTVSPLPFALDLMDVRIYLTVLVLCSINNEFSF